MPAKKPSRTPIADGTEAETGADGTAARARPVHSGQVRAQRGTSRTNGQAQAGGSGVRHSGERRADRKPTRQADRKVIGPEPLDDRERRFVDAYLATGSSSRAAMQVGYASPSSGTTLMRRARVRQEIERRSVQGRRRADSVLDRWWSIVEASYSDYAGLIGARSARAVRAELAKLKQSGLDRAIKRLRLTRNGLEVELYDQLQASELLGKHLGLLRDQLDVTVKAPAVDSQAQRALLADPEACELACSLDARLALPAPAQPSTPKKGPGVPSDEPVDVEWSNLSTDSADAADGA